MLPKIFRVPGNFPVLVLAVKRVDRRTHTFDLEPRQVIFLFPGTSRENPGDCLAWNGRRRFQVINLAVRLFAALGVPQLVRRGRIVRIFRLGRASAKRVEA